MNEHVLVSTDIYGKKLEKKIIKAATDGELCAYVKHPLTGEPIRVHPDLIKKMNNRESVTFQDILNKKFD